jgi:hypothetical protein
METAKKWPGRERSGLARAGRGKLAKKAAKHSDAVMTGILVTRFKMGQIDSAATEQAKERVTDLMEKLKKKGQGKTGIIRGQEAE